jgi:uncharacterized RDD family membrane protein YckC
MQQRHALQWRFAVQTLLFLVIGFYFVWCWTHGGQTLPMKTWRIRLVTKEDGAVSLGRAALRYLLVWMLFVPGLAAAALLKAKGWQAVSLVCLNAALCMLAVYADPGRQFLHDRIAGTRLVKRESPTAA